MPWCLFKSLLTQLLLKIDVFLEYFLHQHASCDLIYFINTHVHKDKAYNAMTKNLYDDIKEGNE